MHTRAGEVLQALVGKVGPASLNDTSLQSVPVFQRVNIQGHNREAAPLTTDQGEQRRMTTMAAIIEAINSKGTVCLLCTATDAALCLQCSQPASCALPALHQWETTARSWLRPCVTSRETSWTSCMTTPPALRPPTSAPSSATTSLSCGVRPPRTVRHAPPSPLPALPRASARTARCMVVI
jgi:hypothetical protein